MSFDFKATYAGSFLSYSFISDCPDDGEGDITLTSLTSPQFCACPKPNPRFPPTCRRCYFCVWKFNSCYSRCSYCCGWLCFQPFLCSYQFSIVTYITHELPCTMVSPSKQISALCFVHMYEQPQQTVVRISEVCHFVPHRKLLIQCIS